MNIQTALISVYDKTGLVDFARSLRRLGIEILSTGGTARALREAGVEHTEVADYTASPEIMDGRVKTLHPRIHGGILCVRDSDQHRAQAEQHGIKLIDLVAVNLYPFTKVVAQPGVQYDDAVENIDIGGPSMIRSAAKNHKYVTVVTDPSDYARVVAELNERSGTTGEMFRRELAVKAFGHTSRYDAAIASFFGGRGKLPDVLTLQFEKYQDCRYGENPHQQGGAYRSAEVTGPSIAHAKFLGGKDLSYNNILDLDSAYELVQEMRSSGCVIVKHNNPCGAGCAESPASAFKKALEGDPLSAFGGLAAFNVTVDTATAELVARKENFFEGIVAPAYAPGVVEILRERTKWGKNVRILETGNVPAKDTARFVLRSVRDGLLVQGADTGLVNERRAAVGTPTKEQDRDLDFAWIVCKHVRSNAIVLAREEKLTGVGAGQMSRVDSAHLAVRKAGELARGSVAASDAFFPFPDAIDALIDAGVTAIIQPGGSIRDKQVLARAEERGIVMVLTGMRHFRH